MLLSNHLKFVSKANTRFHSARMAPALAPSPIDRNCQDVMDVFLNFCKSVDMSHSVGNCGGLWEISRCGSDGRRGNYWGEVGGVGGCKVYLGGRPGAKNCHF